MWSARPPTDVDDKRPKPPSLLAELLCGDPHIAGVTMMLVIGALGALVVWLLSKLGIIDG